MEVTGQLHALAALPRGKSPVPHGIRGWVGHQSRSGRCGTERILLPLLEIEAGRPVRRYTNC
jgi:hypothetical protein